MITQDTPQRFILDNSENIINLKYKNYKIALKESFWV